MSKLLKRLIYFVLGIVVFWTILTIWVTYSGGKNSVYFGDKSETKTALIVYNPDPIYNLDEQVCMAFAEGISGKYYTRVATVNDVNDLSKKYDLYVFCANTYNWEPDKKIKNMIKNHRKLRGQKVVAFTLGAGSTANAKKKLDALILSKKANLIHSGEYWLLKPNDDNRTDEKNTTVACDMARELGLHISREQ